MEPTRRFSEDKLNFLKEALANCEGRIQEIKEPLAVVINKGGVLFELPFSRKDKIIRSEHKSQAGGVGVFIITVNDTGDFPFLIFWIQHYQDKVLRTEIQILGKPIGQKIASEPSVVEKLPRFFTRSLPAAALDANSKPIVESCPLCEGRNAKLTEIIVKRDQKLAQITSREGIFEGKSPSSFSQVPAVALAYQGECGHSWYSIFKFTGSGMGLCRRQLQQDFQPGDVIWSE